jgi:hypothetical protein
MGKVFNKWNIRKAINDLHNSNSLVLTGKINKKFNFIFSNVLVLYLVDCDDDFLSQYFNRNYFPNVQRVYWFNNSLNNTYLLFQFNMDMNGMYNNEICEIFIDQTYTSNISIVLNSPKMHHIRLVNNLYETYIQTNYGKKYITNRNLKIDLQETNKNFCELLDYINITQI